MTLGELIAVTQPSAEKNAFANFLLSYVLSPPPVYLLCVVFEDETPGTDVLQRPSEPHSDTSGTYCTGSIFSL